MPQFCNAKALSVFVFSMAEVMLTVSATCPKRAAAIELETFMGLSAFDQRAIVLESCAARSTGNNLISCTFETRVFPTKFFDGKPISLEFDSDSYTTLYRVSVRAVDKSYLYDVEAFSAKKGSMFSSRSSYDAKSGVVTSLNSETQGNPHTSGIIKPTHDNVLVHLRFGSWLGLFQSPMEVVPHQVNWFDSLRNHNSELTFSRDDSRKGLVRAVFPKISETGSEASMSCERTYFLDPSKDFLPVRIESRLFHSNNGQHVTWG